MGNDGGSIARRTELVKTKAKPLPVDKRNKALAAWLMCALSKLPLSPPVVACPLGKMYNKDALLEYLISPPGTADDTGGNAGAYGADGHAIASHIRSLKDVVELTLTPNPDAEKANSDELAARFICPLSQRPMNGLSRFVYVRHCGCVVNEVALKQLETAEANISKSKPDEEAGACRVCGTPRPAEEPEILVTLNPQGEELERMQKAWTTQVVREAEAKKAKKLAKKRKAGAEADENAPVAKTAKVEPLKSTAPRLPSVVAAAAEAARAKAAASPAIASLYKKTGQQEESWMTRGTYSRFA